MLICDKRRPLTGVWGLCPHVSEAETAVQQQRLRTSVTASRSAVLAEHGRLPCPGETAVHALHAHARPLACTLLTTQRTCPLAGQLEPAARAAHALGRCASEHTSGAFKRFAVFNFVRALVQHRGQLPPARRARGGLSGCSAKPFQRQFLSCRIRIRRESAANPHGC